METDTQQNTTEAPQSEPKPRNGFVRELLDGSLLTKQMVVSQLPFIFFLTVLAVIYIANGYNSEKIVRQSNKLQQELQDLRAESMAIASELMYLSNQTRVVKLIQDKGIELHESNEPAKRIVVTKGF